MSVSTQVKRDVRGQEDHLPTTGSTLIRGLPVGQTVSGVIESFLLKARCTDVCRPGQKAWTVSCPLSRTLDRCFMDLTTGDSEGPT